MTRGWKPKHLQVPEGARSFWNQPITRGFNKKQPIGRHKIKRSWPTLEQPSSINTATFGLKISLFSRLAPPFSPRGSRLSRYGSLSASNGQDKLAWPGWSLPDQTVKFDLVRGNPWQVKLQKVVCPNEVLSDYFVKVRLWERSFVRLFYGIQTMKVKFCQFKL